jgi:glycosyltransferase involved in cell wall biosynthesis
MWTRMITVITPTLNCGKTIQSTIDSVLALASNYPGEVNHFIGDAGSTDDTLAILENYQSKSSGVKVISLVGMNIPATLNYLLEIAPEGWILVLNGDDYLAIDGISGVVANLVIQDEATIVCGTVKVIDQEKKELGHRLTRIDQLGNYMSLNHPAMLVPKHLYKKYGNYELSCPTSFDYIWCWNAYNSGAKFRVFDQIMAFVMLGGISATRANLAAREIFLHKLSNGYFYSGFRNYAIFSFKRTIVRILPANLMVKIKKLYRRYINRIDKF